MSKEYTEAGVELESCEDHGVPSMSKEYTEASVELETCEDHGVP